MNPSSACSLASYLKDAYADAFLVYGDLSLDLTSFEALAYGIVEKHLGLVFTEYLATSFFEKIHTTDLYLAIACARGSEIAWKRLINDYKNYIFDLASFFCSSRTEGRELADGVVTSLFLPDRSGYCRIASYDGRTSLATWLRVIVSRRAINEHERKWNSVERLECLPDIADETGLAKTEGKIRADRYAQAIQESFESAIDKLTDQERLILLLRYEEEFQVAEIAEFLGIHPSTVSRQIQRIQKKLRRQITLTLTSKQQLGAHALSECLTDIVENPGHSLLNLLKV